MNENKIVSSLAFKFTERMMVKVLGLVIGVVLARLLGPEAFGLVAIITVFTNLANAFIHSGLGTALVQNSTTKEEDYSIVFFISLAIAVVMVLLLWLLAPLIAAWYDKPVLIWPLRVMSLPLLIGAFNSIQNARLQRNMQFRKMMFCHLIATILSGIAGVVAAYLGAGLWALVIYYQSNTLIATLCIFVAGGWRPKWIIDFKRAAVFWGYGWKLLVSSLLCSIYNDIRSVVIGGKFSTADLAYYNKGQQFPEIITTTLDNAVQAVMLPVMSAEQDNIERLNRMLLKTLSLSMFIITPMMLGLAAVAHTFIPFLLTEAWMASAPLMVIFCLSSLTIPLMMTNLSVVKALGRSDVYMKMEIIRRMAMFAVLAISVLCFQSVMAIAVGHLISAVIDIVIVITSVRKITGLRIWKQISVIWKSLLAGAIMAGVVYFMNALPMAYSLRLALQVLTGIAIYIGLSAVFKIEPFYYLLNMLKKKNKSTKNENKGG